MIILALITRVTVGRVAVVYLSSRALNWDTQWKHS